MERVAGNCFVDYAHTPDALENVLKTILGFRASSQKVFCVMGCGGNRDRSKRPLMGAIAAKYADHVWITNDNPRFEDPSKIAKEILEGVAASDRARVEVILDRAEAIAQAIEWMDKDDILLVAGKGHETYQIFKDEKKYFSDRDEILRHWAASEAASR
jgi:UDP-N-acetylmuramoyl-L-alanyl-D-glutamate--2,6-diaminopimelate ligase